MIKITRPVMRYPGGKYRLAKWIVSWFPPHDFYVEPYCGAASVFFRKNPSKAEIINDLNGDVVNVFRVLRDPTLAMDLKRRIELTPMAYEEYLMAYEETDDPVEKARRCVFRSFSTIGTDGITRGHSGFRGLKNNESALTTAHEWANYPAVIPAFVQRLKGVIIDQRPAVKVIETYDSPTALIYEDPPYLMSTRKEQRRALYKIEMGDTVEEEEKLHRELAAVNHTLKAKVIISGYDSDLYDELYPGWFKVKTAARAMGNSPRVETLWLSPNIQPQLF